MMQGCAMDSPLGTLYAVSDGQALHYLDWREPPQWSSLKRTPEAELFTRLRAELSAYFAGRLRLFSLPLAPAGTALQRQCWTLLRTVPHGETRSYAFLARAMGRPAAARAVGAMVGRNPISILIPCHRILGSNGRLTGYAGGLQRKRFLLDLEGASYRP